MPPKGKTKRGWETSITDELAERLKSQRNFQKSEKIWDSGTKTKEISDYFRKALKRLNMLVVGRESGRGRSAVRYKIHLYSLRKYFNTTTKVEVGDTFAYAWQGRKASSKSCQDLPYSRWNLQRLKTGLEKG